MSEFREFIFNPFKRAINTGSIIGITQLQINFAASGDNTLVSAVPGRIIRVHKVFLVGAGASNVRFWNGASVDVDPLSGQMNFASGWAIAIDIDDFTMITTAGKALVFASSAAVQVGGWLKYSVE